VTEAKASAYESTVAFIGFCDALGANGVEVARGVFGACMRRTLANDGSVTMVLDA